MLLFLQILLFNLENKEHRGKSFSVFFKCNILFLKVPLSVYTIFMCLYYTHTHVYCFVTPILYQRAHYYCSMFYSSFCSVLLQMTAESDILLAVTVNSTCISLSKAPKILGGGNGKKYSRKFIFSLLFVKCYGRFSSILLQQATGFFLL